LATLNLSLSIPPKAFIFSSDNSSSLRTLTYDNLQPITHFVELFTKHADLPPRVKRLLARKPIQNVLPL
jgi:hypothetical protein